MKETKERYAVREKKFGNLLVKQSKLVNKISNLRLFVSIAGVLGAAALYFSNLLYFLTAELIITLVIFIYLVILHEKAFRKKALIASLVDINKNSIKRCTGEWVGFEDDGAEFIDINHNYSLDLDIFGKGSLFQWINVSKTFLGRQKLKDLLVQQSANPREIKLRQDAVREIAQNVGWRQGFQAEGMVQKGISNNPEALIIWAKTINETYLKPWAGIVIKGLPFLTGFLWFSFWIAGIMPIYIPVIALLIQVAIVSINFKKHDKQLKAVSGYNSHLKSYYEMLKLFEKHNYKSPLLKKLKESMLSEDKASAAVQIGRLSKLVDSISNRYNFFYFIFNVITLWDYRNIITLEKWKSASGKKLDKWLECVGELEALSSLANISFDHPGWVIPEIIEGLPAFNAVSMAHPLIVSNSINNDLIIKNPTKALLITGSNMSGKSTLLRTVGINLVLAYAGAPVCAQAFRVSIMEIHTCMRVSDSLEKSISSFYAELIRIRRIVEAAEGGSNVFYLLDEIFKGTNSIDRHTGAKALILKLSRTNSLGLISTHDLELCDIGRENEAVVNYHFCEYYKDNKIFFDYKLLYGPSTTRNAIYLMRLAGIEV